MGGRVWSDSWSVSRSTCNVGVDNRFPVVLLEMAIVQLTVLSFGRKLGNDGSEVWSKG